MSSHNEICDIIEIFRNKVLSSLGEISDLDITSKFILEQHLMDISLLNQASIVKIQAVIDYMYEQVNVGNWKEVRLFLRKTITIATYLRLLVHLKCNETLTNDIIKEALRIIDFGILFGCPIDGEPKLLPVCATTLHSILAIEDEPASVNTESDIHYDSELLNRNYNLNLLEIINCPSMEDFYRDYMLAEKPVILENCINHWPALTKWQDQNYFIKLAGSRTVSIEVGKDYTDSNWSQRLMTLEEFIKNHIYDATGTTGYLAQYQLFNQIPELKKDIKEPEYCCFTQNNESVDIMAWYGPKGTVSPLHHDAKKNLLTQVVGEKQVFLFSPQDSEHLYPHEHELLNNTARVDPRNPNLEKYPNYKKVNGFFCVLKPGQMLYIPPKWWHFVESLSVSFSVSFWWD